VHICCRNGRIDIKQNIHARKMLYVEEESRNLRKRNKLKYKGEKRE
jgi:hypothetical protein